MMSYAFLLLAADPPAASDGGGAGLFSLAPFLLIGLAFVFLIIMPARRQEKQRQALIMALKKNDRVVNSGGIIGVVESIKENADEVVLRGGVRITRSSIQRIIPPEEGSKE
ncbi:MAG TPA: preprotein translocase subunit YajC [Gemmataceae bacterium]|jgi:preprotein translocase subunit YajC|nr:preprotein translocase subunit YajC [Gemmataceae bacterium]